jgi:hypothetical protein
MAGKTLVVKANVVRAARLRMIVDRKLGRESSEAIKAIANARPAPRSTEAPRPADAAKAEDS